VDEYMSEQEQWEALKRWVREYGRWVVVGIALGAIAVAAWRWWVSYVDARALEASAKYEQILDAFDANDHTRALTLMGELEREHPSSPYVDHANLVAARVAVERNELERAAMLLDKVMKHTKDRELSLVARLRLARVQLAQGKPDDALATLNAVEPGAFASRYHEVRGDVHYAKGDKVAALKEYQAARLADATGAVDVGRLELKIGDLLAEGVSTGSGPATASTAD